MGDCIGKSKNRCIIHRKLFKLRNDSKEDITELSHIREYKEIIEIYFSQTNLKPYCN